MAEGTAGRTVLVVEDNEVEREGLTVILQREGYTVAAAEDGAQALALLRSDGRADLILLDMMLHGQDGWSFLKERQQDPALAAVPVIIVTGLDAANLEWGKSLGARACFRKPVQVAALLEEIRHCVG
jgi:CheY-like chemotaxis protein